MTVDWETLHNAVRTRFGTLVEDTESVTVQYDNQDKVPPNDALWIRFSVRPGASFQASRGGSTKLFRTSGVALAQIFSPLDRGDKEALALADTIASSFRATSVGSVVYETPSVRVIGSDGRAWQVNVECPFFADGYE